MVDLSGRTLGRYRILEPIGKGGMGEVYRALDSELDREVAVKVLPDSVAGDPDRLRRFQREAKAVARLSHPNILEIYDVGEDEGTRYVVTELLGGGTLREHLGKDPLPWAECVEIAAAVARALAAAHDQGVIHRDIKPENVFVVADGRVKVLDFGLARFDRDPTAEDGTQASTMEETAAGVVMGTPGYMSPEQIRGQKVDQRTDVFSLGCVLYELVAGRRPFSGDTAADTMSAVLKEEPKEISGIGIAIPVELERVIRRCLAKEPQERYASAGEIASELEAIPEDARLTETVVLVRKRFGTGVGRWVSRAALIVSVAALLVVVGWWIYQRIPTPGQEEQIETAAIRSVAVGSFENLTNEPEYDIWEQSLPQIVTTVLLGSKDLKVGEPGGDTEGVVTGSVVWAGSGLRLEARLRDEATGRYIVSESAEATSPEDLQQVANAVAGGIRNYLEMGVLRERYPHYAWASRGTSSAEAFRLFSESMNLRLQGDREPATGPLRSALEIDPDFSAASIYLYRNLGRRSEEAEAVLETIEARLDQLSPRERFIIEGEKALRNKDPFRAIEHVLRLIDLDPQDRDHWLWLGSLYWWTEQLDQVIMSLEHWFELQAHEGVTYQGWWPYAAMVSALNQTGQYARALEAAESGMEASSRHRPLVQGAFGASLGLNDPERAERYKKEWTTMVLNEVCGEECVAANLGNLYWGLPDYLDRAEEEYRRSLEIDPGYEYAMLCFGRFLIWEDRGVEEGMTFVERYLKASPDDVDARVTHGRGYHQLGDFEKAVEILERAWDDRTRYNHDHRVFLEAARNALAVQREEQAASATADG